MSPVAPSQRVLEANLAALLRKFGGVEDRVFAFRASPEWTGPTEIEVRGEAEPVRFRVAGCPSALAVREELSRREGDDAYLAILTDRPLEDLGEDVLARIFKHQLLSPDGWEAVMAAFGARRIDPRLAGEGWMAEALLEAAPTRGYPPVPAGFLDAETAWRSILSGYGFDEFPPSLPSLVRWASQPDGPVRWNGEEPERRARLRGWILGSAGETAPAQDLVLRQVEADRADLVVPLGLALGVVFHPEYQEEPTLKAAAVRMESVLGVRALPPDAANRWAGAAALRVEEFVTPTEWRAARSIFESAAAILDEVQAASMAHLSPWLPSGLTQRLDRFGELLAAALAETPVGGPKELEETARAVLAHRLADSAEAGGRTVKMAVRLVRWLEERADAGGAPGDLASAVDAYFHDGAFVDWARGEISGGSGSARLREALVLLRSRVESLREEENRRFARALSTWLESAGTSPLPIERVLDEVVAPLAKARPVILLVLDGMSAAVFRELFEDLVRKGGWTEIAPEETGHRGPVIAALPSVTEVSRASLLSGRLTRGDSGLEKRNFGEHAALRAASKKSKPPRLFHKEDLGNEEALDRVAATIADPDQRVVGVVVNAVDDWLLKGEQVRPRWTPSGIVPLELLLHIARESSRAVVLTSDHGHVIERGTEFRAVETEGERWRPVAGAVGEGEIQLGGARVRAAVGADVIVPCVERVRYGAKRNGYHGGATPQEVVVPLAVLTSGDPVPDGWCEAPYRVPAWWAGPEPVTETRVPSVAVAPTPRPPVTRPRPASQGLLFERDAEPEPAAERPATSSGWVPALVASKTFAEQLGRNARLGLDADRAERFLLALAERGGRMTTEALARRLELPPVRLTSLVAAMRRVLNLDGCSVLSVEVESNTVVLNEDLLCRVFGVER